MKKTIFLLIAITIIFGSYAQSYIPLLQQGNKWNVFRNINYGPPILYTEIFKLGTDSSYYQNKWWKKLYSTTDSSVNATFTFRRYIREEANGKVYILDTAMQSRLYFNFAANIGDTLVLYNIHYLIADTFIVSQVNIETYGGISRKTITTSFNFGEDNFPFEKWIEGIGTTSGINYGNDRPLPDDQIFFLKCFSKNDELIYQKPFFSDNSCYVSEVGIPTFQDKQIKLYPNPIVDYLYIENLPISNTNIKIYDSFGRRVLENKVTATNVKLSLSTFKQGVYFIVITQNNKTITNYKILKMN